MKLIVAGSRTLDVSPIFIVDAIKLLDISDVTKIISGGCRGMDQAGEHWASHFNTPVKRFEADWKTHGKAAGPIRNREMAEYGDELLLIWDGNSRGSASMWKDMRKLKKKTHQIIILKNSKGL